MPTDPHFLVEFFKSALSYFGLLMGCYFVGGVVYEFFRRD